MSTPTSNDAPAAATGVPQWDIGDRIRKARREANMSQQQLADAIGVAVNRLGNWEAGYNKPGDVVAVATAIAQVTGVRADWIAGLYPGGPEGPVVHTSGGRSGVRRAATSTYMLRPRGPRTRLHRPDRIPVAAS